MSDTIQHPYPRSSTLSDALGDPSSSRETRTFPIEASAAPKSTHGSQQTDEEEMEVDLYIEGTSSSINSLKRRASSSYGESGESSPASSRKRLKEDHAQNDETDNVAAYAYGGSRCRIDGRALVEELAQELECGCCSALVYKPVTVHPCEHFFCGSCCVLWIRNGGTSCPACRAISTSVTPSRPLQSMVDILVRADPSRARAEQERAQADEIYRTGASLRIPVPREPSPEPTLPRNSDYAQPCPHCPPGNSFGWDCPQPIVDPETNRDNAWLLEDGAPPGHGYCGNCENLLALLAPTTSRCDFCQVSFCGINVFGRCIAAPLHAQQPHGLSDVGDLIQSTEVYECFDSNTIEVDIMLDYLTEHGLRPREIYCDIVEYVGKTPRQFLPLFELDLFTDVHGIVGGTDPDPTAPRRRICRVCATEVLLWGLKDWWIRERKKGLLNANVLKRKDCPSGTTCRRQKDQDHAREFNHIFDSPETPVENGTTANPHGEMPRHELNGQATVGQLPLESADARSAAEEAPHF